MAVLIRFTRLHAVVASQAVRARLVAGVLGRNPHPKEFRAVAEWFERVAEHSTPLCDVWSTAELGELLVELDDTMRPRVAAFCLSELVEIAELWRDDDGGESSLWGVLPEDERPDNGVDYDSEGWVDTGVDYDSEGWVDTSRQYLAEMGWSNAAHGRY